jgi:hypothetical protein
MWLKMWHLLWKISGSCRSNTALLLWIT